MNSQSLSSLQRLLLWTLRHWGSSEGPRVLKPLADALEDLGPDALLAPTQVQLARYGSCALGGAGAAPASFP